MELYVRSIPPQIHQQFFMQLILRVIAVLMPKYLYTTLCRLLTFMRIIFIALSTVRSSYICKKAHDILYHGTMYHTPLNNTQFSIDAYNALIASIYLHQYFCILKILAHSVDFNELYRNVTIHCPSFSLVR